VLTSSFCSRAETFTQLPLPVPDLHREHDVIVKGVLFGGENQQEGRGRKEWVPEAE
jgi:hypothetical protein